MNVEQVAEVCHNVNKAYCESLGDHSQPSWEETPDWQKSSAKNGVRFHMGNPNSKPSDSHESWMKEKVEDGWVYGEKKDPEKKTHHCIVPFNKLPQEQQAKYFLFTAVVKSLESFIDGDQNP